MHVAYYAWYNLSMSMLMVRCYALYAWSPPQESHCTEIVFDYGAELNQTHRAVYIIFVTIPTAVVFGTLCIHISKIVERELKAKEGTVIVATAASISTQPTVCEHVCRMMSMSCVCVCVCRCLCACV